MVKEKDELLANVLDLSNKKSHENTQCECAFQALVTGNLSNMRDHILREFHSKGLDGKMIATAIITSIKQKKRLCMYLVREALCHLWEEIHEEIKPNIICEVQERFSPWTCSFLAYDLIIRQAEFDGQPYAWGILKSRSILTMAFLAGGACQQHHSLHTHKVILQVWSRNDNLLYTHCIWLVEICQERWKLSGGSNSWWRAAELESDSNICWNQANQCIWWGQCNNTGRVRTYIIAFDGMTKSWEFCWICHWCYAGFLKLLYHIIKISI